MLRPLAQTMSGERKGTPSIAGTTGLLKTIIASARDAMITVDDEQRVVLFNPAAEKMFGISANEMLGQSIQRLIPGGLGGEDSGQAGKIGGPNRGIKAISGFRVNGE